MKLIFMGTPAFAVPSLEAVLAAGHDVAAVFTQPDRPRGRGLVVLPSPVKECALQHGLTVCQPETFKDDAVTETIRALSPDCMAVVAYGRILPQRVLDIPKWGCVNVHGSLLPKYRGAAPIQWAVARGEQETGVTTMYLAREMDAGDMIYSERTRIEPTDTAGSVHDRLMHMGAALLVKTLADIENATAPRVAQDHDNATYAPLLRREDAAIDWSATATAVCAFVRGMIPWPVAFVTTPVGPLKVYEAAESGRRAPGAPGCVAGVSPEGIEVVCGDGQTVYLRRIQAVGGRQMAAKHYARGHQLPEKFS